MSGSVTIKDGEHDALALRVVSLEEFRHDHHELHRVMLKDIDSLKTDVKNTDNHQECSDARLFELWDRVADKEKLENSREKRIADLEDTVRRLGDQLRQSEKSLAQTEDNLFFLRDKVQELLAHKRQREEREEPDEPPSTPKLRR